MEGGREGRKGGQASTRCNMEEVFHHPTLVCMQCSCSVLSETTHSR